MAISAEELNIILSAKDKQFNKAMDRANRKVQRFAHKSKKNLNQTTKSFDNLTAMVGKLGIALSTGALVTGLARSIDSTTKFAKELTNLSNLAGVGVEDFQRLSFAAKTVGVEQDKLADILKDVNDKMGDFLITGQGTLVDFFEQIAPKVGITADAFRGLSSADALGLYVQKLQEAGVNQQQLTFFMEALASDATLLTPLLQNNGKAMDELAAKADALGLVLSADLVGDASELRKEFEEVMAKMTSASQKFFMTVALGFAEIFNVETDRSRLSRLTDELDASMRELAKGASALTSLQKDLLDAEEKGSTARIEKRKKEIALTEKLNDREFERFKTLRDEINALKALLNPEGDPLVLELTAGVATTTEETKKLRGAIVGLSGDIKDLHSMTTTLESAFEDVFMSAIEGSKSFKDTLKSSAQAVIRELYRILVVQRLVNAAMGFMGVTSGGVNVPTGTVPDNLASGGYMQAGQAAVVGEHGREIFVPSTAGRVLSVGQAQSAISGGDGVTINQTINVTTGVQQTVRNEIKTMLPQIAESAKAAVVDSKRRGGSYGRAFS